MVEKNAEDSKKMSTFQCQVLCLGDMPLLRDAFDWEYESIHLKIQHVRILRPCKLDLQVQLKDYSCIYGVCERDLSKVVLCLHIFQDSLDSQMCETSHYTKKTPT